MFEEGFRIQGSFDGFQIVPGGFRNILMALREVSGALQKVFRDFRGGFLECFNGVPMGLWRIQR